MLRSEGFNVYTTADLGEEGIDVDPRPDYDIVLDLQLPDMSGFEVLKTLRLAKVQTPVLILSGNAIVEAKVKALGFGADDYMTKPFHEEDELVARIQVRRRGKATSRPEQRRKDRRPDPDAWLVRRSVEHSWWPAWSNG